MKNSKVTKVEYKSCIVSEVYMKPLKRGFLNSNVTCWLLSVLVYEN